MDQLKSGLTHDWVKPESCKISIQWTYQLSNFDYVSMLCNERKTKKLNKEIFISISQDHMDTIVTCSEKLHYKI